MQTRKFGGTDLEITAIGFGSWAIGGSGWAAGWGPQDDEESISAIRRTLELGVIGAAELRLSEDELEEIEGFLNRDP